MELSELNQKVEKVLQAQWNRLKAISDYQASLTVRVQALETAVELRALSVDVQEMAKITKALEAELQGLRTDTFISRSVGAYGDRLVELLAEIVARRIGQGHFSAPPAEQDRGMPAVPPRPISPASQGPAATRGPDVEIGGLKAWGEF